MRLRLLARQLEELTPTRFILAVSLAGSVGRGVPGFFVQNAAIQTNGALVEAFARTPLNFALTNLELILIQSLVQSLVRFLGAAALVALGRQPPGSSDFVAPQPPTSTNSEAVA